MAKRYWNMGIVRLFNDVLYDEALSQTPNGLRYHIIDICVEELAKVNKEAAVSLTEATFLDCLEPFFAMVQRVQDRNVQKRVVDNVMMKFLNEYSFVSDAAVSEEEDVDGKDLIFHQVHVGTVAKFIFEIASDGDTDVRYRKCLYEMHKTFIRKIRAAGRDVDTEAGRDEEEEGEEDGCGACGTSETCVVVTPIDGATVTPDGTDEKASKEEPLSKKDKKMKRKNKDKAKKGVEEPDAAAASAAADPDPEPKVEESVPATKSSKKKKRKQQQEETASEPAVTTPTAQSNDANETEQSNKSKKKKRKKEAQEDETLTTKIELPPVSKKKKKNQKAAEPEIAVNSNGEVVATSDGEEQGNAISASKRVSFGARNQSKSHKASMKALKTLTPKVWSTANRTPDKSILLKRAESEVKQIKTKKKKRRST
jgi:DNA polymerase III gamma/tau subunit